MATTLNGLLNHGCLVAVPTPMIAGNDQEAPWPVPVGDGCFTFMVNAGNGVERGLQRQNCARLNSHLVDGIEPNNVDPVSIMAGITTNKTNSTTVNAKASR